MLEVPNNTLENKEIITAYSEIMKEVLVMAKDQDFKMFMYENARQLNNEGSDYVIYLDNVTSKFKSTDKFSKSTSKIETLSAKVQSLNNGKKPMVFFPKAETLEDRSLTQKGFSVAKALNEPIAVLKGAYYDDYSAPGYTLSNSGNLTYSRNVTQDYAWENDVYIIGDEELVDCFDCVSIGNPNPPSPSNSGVRFDGRAEYGGQIKVTDLNAIEHWFSGQLEFQIVVAGAQGNANTVILNRKFSQVKRKHFKDNKWFDYNVFIANWNTSNLGQFNFEKWIERDGGKSASIGIPLPGIAATSTTPAIPGATVTVPSEDRDDDLGLQIVQFSDNLSQIYSISYMDFKRRF